MALSIRSARKESLAWQSVPYALAGLLLLAAWSPLSWWLGLVVNAAVEGWPRCEPRPDRGVYQPAGWIALAALFGTTFVPVSRCLATGRHRRAIGMLLAAPIVGWGATWLLVNTDACHVFGWFVD